MKVNFFGCVQVLQDMGLPTGVELKSTEVAVKLEETVVAIAAEEVKPAIIQTESSTATAGATPESAEVSVG